MGNSNPLSDFQNSLDCREGHMKIICLCVSVCVFASRSKEHHISRRVLLVIDRWNLVGSWVSRVEELESDVSF